MLLLLLLLLFDTKEIWSEQMLQAACMPLWLYARPLLKSTTSMITAVKLHADLQAPVPGEEERGISASADIRPSTQQQGDDAAVHRLRRSSAAHIPELLVNE